MKKNKTVSNVLIIIGVLLMLVGFSQSFIQKDYLMREYGFGCRNVFNQVSSSFELTEPTKVFFEFYCKAEGNMTVNIRDGENNIIFQTDTVNFDEHFSKDLPAGVYYYDIDYDSIIGDFEIYAAKRSFFGILF